MKKEKTGRMLHKAFLPILIAFIMLLAPLSCTKARLIDEPFDCVILEGDHGSSDRSKRCRKVTASTVSWSVEVNASWVEEYPEESWREQHAWNKLVGFAEDVFANILSFQNPSVTESAMFGWRYMTPYASKTYSWGPIQTLQLCAYSHHGKNEPWEETLIGDIAPGDILDLSIERSKRSDGENCYNFFVNGQRVATHTRSTRSASDAVYTFGPWHGGVMTAQHDHFFQITHRDEDGSLTDERLSPSPWISEEDDRVQFLQQLERVISWDTSMGNIRHRHLIPHDM